MNTDTEQLIRQALHDWSDHAPHDPDLLGSVLTRGGSTTPRTTNHRGALRRILVPTLAIGLTAATVAVGVRVLDHPSPESIDPAPATTSSLRPEEVDELTAPGAHGLAWNDPKVEQAWQQKWGVSDIGNVSDALRAAAKPYPAADAGLTYDPDTLTYTQWLVNGAAETTGLRDAAQGAFDRAAADSNLALSFTTSTTSYEVSRALLDKLVTASRTDPEWPDGLALTGDWSPEQGKFILSAGDRSSDPAALTYFERRWPGLIFLSPQTPATPQ